MYIIHILEWAAHPSEMESITIIPKHKIIEIKNGKELLGYIGFFFCPVNPRSLFNSII